MPEISIQDLESCNELITHLITLTLTLKDTVKTEKILRLEIKKLEQKKINELKLLEEKIFFMMLSNIMKEETDLIEQAKRR